MAGGGGVRDDYGFAFWEGECSRKVLSFVATIHFK